MHKTICPCCGSSISKNATTCPECGYRKPFYKRLWFYILTALLVAVIIYFLLPINHVVGINITIGSNENNTYVEDVGEDEYPDWIYDFYYAYIYKDLVGEDGYPDWIYDFYYAYIYEEPVEVVEEPVEDVIEYYYVDTLLSDNQKYMTDLTLVGLFVGYDEQAGKLTLTGLDTSVDYNTYVYVYEQDDTYSEYLSTLNYGDEITVNVNCYYSNSEDGYACTLLSIY